MKHIARVTVPKKAACEDVPDILRQTILLPLCLIKEENEQQGKEQ